MPECPNCGCKFDTENDVEEEPNKEEIEILAEIEKEEKHEVSEFHREAYYKKKGWVFEKRPYPEVYRWIT